MDFLISADDIEIEFLEEFFETFEQFHVECEYVIIKLENQPENYELLQALKLFFDGLLYNSMKLNFVQISELFSESANVLDKLVNWRYYPKGISELLLLVLDRILAITTKLLTDRVIDIRETQRVLVSLQHVFLVDDPKDVEAGIEMAIYTIKQEVEDSLDDNKVICDISFPKKKEKSAEKNNKKIDILIHKDALNPVLQAEEFFKEEISQHPFILLNRISEVAKGRSDPNADCVILCLACNFLAQSPIEPKALALGICLRDIALAAIPDILRKDARLSDEEREIIRRHPLEGLELAQECCDYEVANQVVIEHHERYDGSGYPHGIKGKNISDAGRLVGIIDSFYGMIGERYYRKYSKDVFRAVVEINAGVDILYDKDWLQYFNLCLRKYWLPIKND